ncbi:Ribonuclease 3 [Limihaloglobus sulfuriphilus]|uniref:Ribonuclease 3 n=1 Tax=Limihaloglobus sulfuriphilus TaxID=1851148 RepID=A0A1Q2MBF3_9BACT|nr:ribonuclease III [Limihaloglobus sulfuriphilus]AQQ69989.1 Ribonuclease 3 [Limihaloglobus sulfuriphilus]
MEQAKLDELQELIGYRFKDQQLLSLTLTHTSSVSDRIESNERHEFFGDAVLDLVICQELFEKYPDYSEGDLTKIKSRLVSRETCAEVAEKINLVDYLYVGRGTGSRGLKGSIVAGTLEALIAGIYIDGGLKPAAEFINKLFGELVDSADADEHQDNYKSLLQQYSQQNLSELPIYEVIDEQGPEHNKCFEVEVSIGNVHYSSAWGISKKIAEQAAAKKVLEELGVIEVQNKP